jgi:hypothetical protein
MIRHRRSRAPRGPGLAACAVLALSGALVAAAVPAAGPQDGTAAREYLTRAFGLSRADLERIDRGQVVSRTLDAQDRREVSTLGVVRVKVAPAFYVEQFADIAGFKKDDAILQIGTFGTPPSTQDVAGLTLDDADVKALRGCHPGDCGVQLSADAIAQFRADVNWRAPDAHDQANRLMRRILVEYVARYRESGAAQPMRYADRAEPLDLAREFGSLVGADACRLSLFPRLRRHVLDYPAETPDTTDLVYWSKEKVGRRGVVTVTHLAISRTGGESPADYAIASKQIYAAHYYDASLGLTVLLDDASGGSAATYVAYLNRSRIDIFGGLFGGLARPVVSGKARSTVSEQLARVQRTLEQRARGAKP